MKLFGFNFFERKKKEEESEHGFHTPKTFTERQREIMAYNGQQLSSAFENSVFDGSKYPGSFGLTQLQRVDYWTLRQRSTQLFNENIYARGMVRRLLTNEINTGLTLDANPDDTLLGISEDEAFEWSDKTETLFSIWAKDSSVCDWHKTQTFGALQRTARMEALIAGDVLVVLRQSRDTKLPMIQLVSGNRVKTPWTEVNIKKNHEIKHGVEFDKNGRVVAYWIEQDDYSFTRLVANSAKTGRRISWLVFGTEKRLDDCRGLPLLSLVLSSLKEIDRYRDSAQRKATINAMLAMFIRKTQDKMSSLPIQGSAVRKDTAIVENSDGLQRSFNISNQIPGTVIEELQQGEEPVGFNSNGTDIDFQAFEETIISAVAWANEIPPEILKLAFSNNYSASQAAINEFKIYLNRFWGQWGEEFCAPIYTDWLHSQVLLDNISAPGFLEAVRDPAAFETLGAWTSADFYGSIKPSTDQLKQAKGSVLMIENAFSTHAREARNITGTKFSKNIKKLKRENELLVEALRPIKEFESELSNPQSAGSQSEDINIPEEGESNARINTRADRLMAGGGLDAMRRDSYESQ